MDQPSSRGTTGGQEGSTQFKTYVRKRKVRSNVATELHLLPLDVLYHILSRLSLKEVARMSVLSPEWRRLRICHPDLVFTKDTFFSKKTKMTKWKSTAAKFVTKVDNVLLPLWSSSTATTTTLDKFVVRFALGKIHSDHIDRWISFSIASRTKHIALDFKFADGYRYGPDNYLFPLCNLTGPNGSCVTSLELCHVCLNLPSGFCGIRNLKKLKLHSVSVSVSDFECLLLSCALLESLNIQVIWWLKSCSFPSLCIHQELSGLKYLRMHECSLDMMELHAPNLTAIDFNDSNQHELVLGESLNLSEATIKSYRGERVLHDSLAYVFNELPTDLPHVHRLFLDLGLEFSVQRLRITEDRYMKLRYLNMNVLIIGNLLGDTSWVKSLVNLLGSAPLLEEFEMHMDVRGTRRDNSKCSVKAACGHPHRHLRSVYMTGFSSLGGVAELALYILGNATVLEHMVVDSMVRKSRSNAGRIYSVSKANEFAPLANEFAPRRPTEEERYDMKNDRLFAKRNLDREEYRHVLTIL